MVFLSLISIVAFNLNALGHFLNITRTAVGSFTEIHRWRAGAYKELIDAGVDPGAAKKATSRSYKKFDSLGAFQ